MSKMNLILIAMIGAMIANAHKTKKNTPPPPVPDTEFHAQVSKYEKINNAIVVIKELDDEDTRNNGANALCGNTADWTDGDGNDCAAYKYHGWCSDCDVGENWSDNWAGFDEHNYPLSNCKKSCGCCHHDPTTCDSFTTKSACHEYTDFCVWESNLCVERCVCVRVNDNGASCKNACSYCGEDFVWCYVKIEACEKVGKTVYPSGSSTYSSAGIGWTKDLCRCDCLGVTNDAGNGADCSAGWCYMYNGLPLIETGLPGCDRFTHISIHESSNDKLNGLYIGYSYEICDGRCKNDYRFTDVDGEDCDIYIADDCDGTWDTADFIASEQCCVCI